MARWMLLCLLAASACGATSCNRSRAEAPASAAADARKGAEKGAEKAVSSAAPDRAEAAPVAEAEAEPPSPPSPAEAGTCPEQAEDAVGLLVAPRHLAVDGPVRVLAATLADEHPLAMRIERVDGSPLEREPTFTHRPGVPSAVLAGLVPQKPGRLRVVIGREGKGLRCAEVVVRRRARATDPPQRDGGSLWPIARAWNGAEEALYSAWVRELFHAPRGEELAFRALHELTSDPERNVLHNALGWNEDHADVERGLYLQPDCADAPYFLRAYFAWKRRLPMGFRHCSRGGNGKAPRCGPLQAIPGSGADGGENIPNKPGELGAVQYYFRRTLAWGVHTGNGRTALGNDRTDLYPVKLSRRSLRPGTVYADPYGHILVVVELMEPEGKQPGVLYAIDGQPDGSITRKRFWEGTFLWNPDPALGGSGFKAFRPIVVTEEGARALSNERIAAREDYGDASEEQGELEPAAFYDRMERLISPGTRDPLVAQKQVVQALYEAATIRVTSVENGERYLAKNGGGTVDMPKGYSIFETTGAWENYSTPARDLRLLIAMDVVSNFPGKVVRAADAYGIEGSAEAVKQRLDARLAALLDDSKYAFEYERSDGTTWTLTLADLMDRAKRLEMAYNPNDCPEIRWGAPKGSKERSTCDRHAPAAQRRKMKAYRPWFRDRKRPPRGDPGPPVQ